jgi:hypothetical protein
MKNIVGNSYYDISKQINNSSSDRYFIIATAELIPKPEKVAQNFSINGFISSS